MMLLCLLGLEVSLNNTNEFYEGRSHWSITFSFVKTKGLAVKAEVNEEDIVPVRVQGGVIDIVKD